MDLNKLHLVAGGYDDNLYVFGYTHEVWSKHQSLLIDSSRSTYDFTRQASAEIIVEIPYASNKWVFPLLKRPIDAAKDDMKDYLSLNASGFEMFSGRIVKSRQGFSGFRFTTVFFPKQHVSQASYFKLAYCTETNGFMNLDNVNFF